MNVQETTELLAFCALIDNRKGDEQMIAAWNELLAGLTFPECRAAVVDYYRENREMVMPSDIYERAWGKREQWYMLHPGVGPQNPELIPPWETGRELEA